MPYANSGVRREVKNTFSTSSSLLKAKTSSEKSILLQNDYGKRIEGEYKGTGKLQQGSNIIESYSNLKIIMTRINRNKISVEIFMNDEPVFAPCFYKIKSLGDNNFTLTSEDNYSNKIKIVGNKVIYDNPSVKIDGNNYSLKITAKAVE